MPTKTPTTWQSEHLVEAHGAIGRGPAVSAAKQIARGPATIAGTPPARPVRETDLAKRHSMGRGVVAAAAESLRTR